MTPATWRQPTAGVSQFRRDGFDPLGVSREAGAATRLPVYVEPAADEALASWLWRLAGRLGVSMSALSHALIGTKVVGAALAWCRPSESDLQRIAVRTGTEIGRLRAMTFASLGASARDDEVNERFCNRRFLRSLRQWPLHDWISVCPACLLEGAYLRSFWMLGWVGLCSRHGAVLLSHCPCCGQRFRLPRSEAHTRTAIARCAHCGADIGGARETPAHGEAVQFQEALLLGKRHGTVALPGLGAMGWPIGVALMDVLLTVARVGTTSAAQDDLHACVGRDLELPPITARQWSGRYGSSLVLMWLLRDWPRNFNLCYRLVGSPRLDRIILPSSELDEPTSVALRELFRSARARRPSARLSDRRRRSQVVEVSSRIGSAVHG